MGDAGHPPAWYSGPTSALTDAAKQIPKTLGDDLAQLGMLAPRLVTAMGVKGAQPAIDYADSLHRAAQPTNAAESAAQFGTHMAEFAAPAGPVGRAIEGMPALARMGVEAARAGLTSAAQAGGDPIAAAGGAISGGLGEATNAVVPWLARNSAVKNWMSMLQKAGLNPFQKAALKEALETAGSDLPVGGAETLIRKTAQMKTDAGNALEGVYNGINHEPADLTGPVDNLTTRVNSPAYQTVSPTGAKGMTIQPKVPDITFSQLTPQAQATALKNPDVMKAVMSGEDAVIIPGTPEILKNPPLASAIRDVTGDIQGVQDVPGGPKVWQARALKQSLNQQATKALDSGIVTPRGDALKLGGGEVADAMHSQYPELKDPDAAYSTWKTISDRTQKAFGGGDPATISSFSKYLASKLLIGGLASGAAEVGGQSHQKSAAIGLGAMALTAVGQSAFWNSMSAATKNSIASMIENGENDGAVAALRAASMTYVAKQRSNKRLSDQESSSLLQRAGATE